ncbi:MAG TPA: response regulator [Nitrospirota bacterium]|nr:response regulator [Nitrospirota bacterium]
MADFRAKTTSHRLDRRSRFLLVVDSDANSLSYTSMLLHRFNYQIFKASTAEEALQMATVALPALVITALTLKGMSGFELMQQLREYPITDSIPFIALSRQDNLIVKRRCFELGAVDCLYHPVSPEMLYRAVQVAAEKTPRTSMRIRTSQPVQVTNMPLEGFEGAYALELSERGLFLRTMQLAVRDMRLSLQLDLNGQLIVTEAIVVYNCPAQAGPYHEPGLGLQFVQISKGDQERIRKFIMTEVMRDIVPDNYLK